MEVKKSNNSLEEFDPQKVYMGICEAYNSCGEECPEDLIESLIKNLFIYDRISTSEIRRQVEECLMSINKKVAKSYIGKYENDKELLNRDDFIHNYIKATNASTGSKYDSNANVSNKNIATLNAEIPKGGNIRFNRYNTSNKIANMYSKKLAKQYISDLENHIMYKHDESSFGLNSPYTYSAKEVIEVKYNDKHLMLPFDLLWDILDEEEVLVNKLDDVYQKYPSNLYVKDMDNVFTHVTVMTKKLRKRDLVRVKTAFGEDVVVTDNHPMIIDKENVNDTIQAIDSLNAQQYKLGNKLEFGSVNEIDMVSCPDIQEVSDVYCISYNGDVFKRKLIVDAELGYLIGFFVGDGNYNNGKNGGSIVFTQKDRNKLVQLNEILFNKFGYVGRIRYKRDKTNCFNLTISQNSLWWVLNELFKIQDKSENKTLPYNLLEYNEEFSKGLVSGLIDADGTINDCQISVRLSSRAAILQLTSLLRHFNYGVGNIIQNLPFSNNISYNTNYTLWGVNCSVRTDSTNFDYCDKLKKARVIEHSVKYKNDGYVTITNITKILENDAFLGLNEYIYDITTDTRTFECNNLLVHNCVAIQSYPFLTDGIKGLGGLSAAPKNIDSFCGMFVNLIFAVSSQFAGAVAVSGFFNMFDYYARKEWGDNYYIDNNRPAKFKYTDGEVTEISIDKQIEQYFQEVVYSINQPAAARGFQSAFTNFAYFDKPYFDGMYGSFVFPDGTKPQWESISWLQKKFMKWFNKERTKCVLTFPVETMSLLYKDGKFVDEEYADFTAEMYAEGHSFFTYISDSPDTLSSCCFSKNQKTLSRSSNGINYMTFEELYNSKWDDCKRNFTIFHNGSWVKGKVVKLPNRKMYKVITSNNKEYIISDNHINVTFDGEKETQKLTTEDYLMFNTKKLNAINEKDEHLTYEQGFAIGAFLGDGSFGGEIKGVIYETNFSQNVNKFEQTMSNITIANKQLGSESDCILGPVYNNVYPLKISSKKLVSFIMKWTNWSRGTYSFNKELNLNVLEQSYEFRKGILDGWYATDGSNSNRCYTSSPKLAESMEVLISSLGLNTIINVSDRTDEKVIIRGVEYNRNYPLYCVRWYDSGNKRTMENVYKWKNNSIYFKIKTIEEVDYCDDIYCFEMDNIDEPYFTLPNGLITHNCRLSNKIQENTFSFTNGLTGESTGSKSVITLNYNRIVQNFVNETFNGDRNIWLENKDEFKEKFINYLIPILERIYKYHTAYNEILWDLYEANMLPVYSAGFIHLNKQYLTIGLNGVNEAWMYLGGECRYSDDYKEFCNLISSTMRDQNALHRTRKTMFNSEYVPAESLGIKNYNWDKNDGYWIPEDRNCYTSYFFLPDDDNVSVLEKMQLHGKDFVSSLDGGSACHINLKEHLSYEQYRHLLNFAGDNGTNYFTFNVKNSACRKCGYISKHTLKECPHCGSDELDYYTRIIGYLIKVNSFNEGRQIEEKHRIYS